MKPIDDPEVLAFIAKTDAAYPPEANSASIADNRRFYDAMCALFRKPRPAGVAAFDERIGAVPVRVYRRSHAPAGIIAGGPAAVIYAHGGGFVVGSLESHDDVCAELAERTGVTVIAVDYRLAPEHRHPAQLDDVEAVWHAVSARFDRVVVAGDSAGGTLVAGLCVRLARLGRRRPDGLVLIYPGLGGDRTAVSYIENAEAPMLRTADLEPYDRARFAGLPPAGPEAEAYPLRADDPAIFPPSFVVTADVDPLRDDGTAFVARLAGAGVAVIGRNEPQLVHGFLRARYESARAAAAFDAIVAAVESLAGV